MGGKKETAFHRKTPKETMPWTTKSSSSASASAPASAANSAPPRPPSPPWVELPREITANILQRLGPTYILNTAQRVCMTWRDVCLDPSIWRVINMGDDLDLYDDEQLEMLCRQCRRAVDRSQGQLVDLRIKYFATDELLIYVGKRSDQLRRLQLMCCKVTNNGLIEAAKYFPLLEDLHIHFSNIHSDAIEVVGRSSPMLKSFTYDTNATKVFRVECNETAFAISENMHQLRHLQIIGNYLTNDGLNAILDGCPHLEMLDLRRCFNIDLGGALGRRCAQQIKNLRLPNDSTEDYEFEAQLTDDDGSYGLSDDDMISDILYFDHDGSDFDHINPYDSDYEAIFSD